MWLATLLIFSSHIWLLMFQWGAQRSFFKNNHTVSVEIPFSLSYIILKSTWTHGLFINFRTGQGAAEHRKHQRCRCAVKLGRLCHNWSHISCWQHFTHQSCCTLSGRKRVSWMACVYSSTFETRNTFLVRFGSILGVFGRAMYLLCPNSAEWAWYLGHIRLVTWYRGIFKTVDTASDWLIEN